jgi:hypothetical protein
MIVIHRKDGTLQVIPTHAVRMVEYLPLVGVIRVHYLTERPLYIEVKVGEREARDHLLDFASGVVVDIQEEREERADGRGDIYIEE